MSPAPAEPYDAPKRVLEADFDPKTWVTLYPAGRIAVEDIDQTGTTS